MVRASLAPVVTVLAILTTMTATMAAGQTSGPSPERALLDRYCVTCHNDNLRTGGLALDTMDVATGEEVWRERRFARAHMVYADGKLVIIDEDGDLAIASVGDQGLEVHAQTPLLTENAWTPPTLVGTTLYVRDRRNILALDLGR